MSERTSRILRIAIWTLALAWVSLAWAQQATPAPGQPPAGKDVEVNITLWGLWVTGGWAMYPIALLSIAGTALTVYGFLFTREEKMVQSHLVPMLQAHVNNLDFRAASGLCTQNPGVLTNIVNAGLLRLADGITDVAVLEKAMEEAAVEENTNGLRPISYLSIFASTAPMFGLLGTVSGMIKAFQKIGLGAMGSPEKLAGNIGEAMITTAFGLIVGIPLMFFYFYLKSRFQGNMARIGRLAGNITHHMSAIFDRLRSGELPLDRVTLPELTMPLPAAAPASVPTPASPSPATGS